MHCTFSVFTVNCTVRRINITNDTKLISYKKRDTPDKYYMKLQKDN